MKGKKGQITFMVKPSTTFIIPNTVKTCLEIPPSVIHTGPPDAIFQVQRPLPLAILQMVIWELH